jgi:hypothetical protein
MIEASAGIYSGPLLIKNDLLLFCQQIPDLHMNIHPFFSGVSF